MTPKGEVRLVLSSRRVPVRTVSVPTPVNTQTGLYFAPVSERRVVYDLVYDASQLEAMEEAKRLSEQLGLRLKVIDQSRISPFRRVLSRLTAHHGSGGPTLSLKKSWRTQTGSANCVPPPTGTA